MIVWYSNRNWVARDDPPGHFETADPRRNKIQNIRPIRLMRDNDEPLIGSGVGRYRSSRARQEKTGGGVLALMSHK